MGTKCWKSPVCHQICNSILAGIKAKNEELYEKIFSTDPDKV